MLDRAPSSKNVWHQEVNKHQAFAGCKQETFKSKLREEGPGRQGRKKQTILLPKDCNQALGPREMQSQRQHQSEARDGLQPISDGLQP